MDIQINNILYVIVNYIFMPNFEVLYYPNFEPSQRWIRSHLLFFDTVKSIIPEDDEIELSDDILELQDEIPNSFNPFTPRKKDIKINDLNIEILRKAFAEIRRDSQNTISDKVTIDYSSNKISIPRRAFLHNDKISSNVFDLLNQFDLIERNSQEVCDLVGAKNFHVVDKRAFDLIISLVADNIANSYGFNTITDQSLSFTVNCLNSFDYNALGDSRSLLSYSLINCVIPQEIEKLSIEDYAIIHDEYIKIHEPFQEVVSNLDRLCRLENVNEYSILEEKVNEITLQFDSEIEELKKSGILAKVKRWGSIVIGGAAVASSAGGHPEISLSIKTGSLIMQSHRLLKPSIKPQFDRTPIQRMIGNLQKDILKQSQIEALV
jgi:hypothetical protein